MQIGRFSLGFESLYFLTRKSKQIYYKIKYIRKSVRLNNTWFDIKFMNR